MKSGTALILAFWLTFPRSVLSLEKFETFELKVTVRERGVPPCPEAVARGATPLEHVTREEAWQLLHPGYNPKPQLALMQQLGLTPSERIAVSGGSMVVGRPFQSQEDPRFYVYVVVEKPGAKYFRLFYLSNTHGTWKVFPATFQNEIVKYAWEAGLNAPSELVAFLFNEVSEGRVVRNLDDDILDELIEDAVPSITWQITDYWDPEKVGVFPFDPFTGQRLASYSRDMRLAFYHAEEVLFGQTEMAPDYSRVIATFLYEGTYSKASRVYVYASRNGQWRYHIHEELSSGRIWPASITSQAEINVFGVPGLSICYDQWVLPLYERDRKVPGNYSSKWPAEPGIVHTWKYWSKVKFIQDWYTAQGRPLPK